MSKFRLLTRTRQITEYSCGVCALQAVLAYWGRSAEETELIKLLNTTPEEGTYPEAIVRVARSLGFQAEARENVTLDQVREFTANGDPMIALGQFWRSESSSPASAAEDWECGHYIVVLGVDDGYVYFQDPYARMSKVFVPRKTFEDHWHQIMGGAATKNPKLTHTGIFVRGDRPAVKPAATTMGLADVVFDRFGALNLMVFRFSRVLMPFDLMEDMKKILADGSVRLNAYILVRKDAAGSISGIEGGCLQEQDEMAAMNAVISAITSRSVGSPELARSKAEEAVKRAVEGDFGLSADDIQRMAQQLPPNHSAIALLLENTWEGRLKEAFHKHGGAMLSQRLITPEALARAARELAAAGEPLDA